jgi:hypothetical protein
MRKCDGDVMSKLRRHLGAMKRHHDGARYPGDLARDVLPTVVAPRRIIPFTLRVKLAAAIAACVIVAILFVQPKTTSVSTVQTVPLPALPSTGNEIVAATEPTETEVQVDMSQVTALVPPAGIEIAPSAPDEASFPSMPSFPVDGSDDRTESTIHRNHSGGRMRFVILSVLSLALIAAMAPRSLMAQDSPPPPRQDGEDGGGHDRRPPPPPRGEGHGDRDDDGDGRRPPPPDGRGPGGPGGGPRGGGPSMGNVRVPPELAIMQGYLSLVDQFQKLAKDPAAAGVAAVLAANDMLKGRGADAGIEYFTKLLPDVKNEAVQRAIRIQLIDLYKKANQPDKALEQMRILMTAAPEGRGCRARKSGDPHSLKSSDNRGSSGTGEHFVWSHFFCALATWAKAPITLWLAPRARSPVVERSARC